jgi:hypothetical protein
MARSELTAQLVPELNLGWEERLAILKQDIAGLVPRGARVVLADENQWGPAMFPELDAIPYVERDGQYWGPPGDDDQGIRELERLRSGGADYFLAGWPAFWLLDYYSGLRDYLESQYPCIANNSRMIVYDLQGTTGQQGDKVPNGLDTGKGNGR